MAETGKKRAQNRRQRLCGAVVLLCVFLQMLAGTVAGAETEINTAESTEGSALRIAVASDLHLDPDNTDKSQVNEVVYNMELVDALLRDAKKQGAKAGRGEKVICLETAEEKREAQGEIV